MSALLEYGVIGLVTTSSHVRVSARRSTIISCFRLLVTVSFMIRDNPLDYEYVFTCLYNVSTMYLSTRSCALAPQLLTLCARQVVYYSLNISFLRCVPDRPTFAAIATCSSLQHRRFYTLDESAEFRSIYRGLAEEYNLNISEMRRVYSGYQAVQVLASFSIFEVCERRENSVFPCWRQVEVVSAGREGTEAK
jgi:hypothetical protein